MGGLITYAMIVSSGFLMLLALVLAILDCPTWSTAAGGAAKAGSGSSASTPASSVLVDGFCEGSPQTGVAGEPFGCHFQRPAPGWGSEAARTRAPAI